MKVLGVHASHDASAALVVDGQVVAHVAEERFNRQKHYGYLPIQAIGYCLEAGGIAFDELDYIALTYPLLSPGIRLLFQLDEEDIKQALKDNGKRAWSQANLWRRARERLRGSEVVPEYVKLFRKAPHTRILEVDHHTAHAAAAYYTSGFNNGCLVVTSDGEGDGTSMAVWRASGGKLAPLRRFGRPGSLGSFYELVTEALGWWIGDGEGKTMGLAPYGNPDAFPDEVLTPYLPHYDQGELAKPVDFGRFQQMRLMDTSRWHSAHAPEVQRIVERYGKEDVAAKAQRLLEQEMVPFVEHWARQEQAQDLAAAGGVFLNVKMNQKIIERGLADRFSIFPDAGDAGITVGAALALYYAKSGETETVSLRDLFWGPSYATAEVEEILRSRNLNYCRSENVSAEAARLLAEGKILGWFQGRMESGPRALGNRSILMDPRRPENKDIINARVKFREPFRPFCPSMTPEAARRYLRFPQREERYMICAYEATEAAVRDIPAVVHVDRTVRPQVVGDENPKFRALIEEFGRLTGVPAVLNTSFNIRGEPIVCSPRDAIKCFFDTGMDVLALDDFLVYKG